MSEILESTGKIQSEPAKMKKKGFTLPETTVFLLEEKSRITGHKQSTIVDSVLTIALPVYGENGMDGAVIVSQEEDGNTAAADEPVIPAPEPPPMNRGRREKLRVPLPQASHHPELAGEPEQLYRPNMDPLPAEQPPTHTAMSGVQGTGEIEASMQYLLQQVAAMQQMMMQQMAQQPNAVFPPPQPPVPQPVQQEVPQPPPVFAASYPPGYTGPPGTMPVPQQQPAPQGQIPQQPQPPQDQFAMNLGQGGSQAPLTAQGLLSGNQQMGAGAGGRNIHADMARAAQGGNWRNQLHNMTQSHTRE